MGDCFLACLSIDHGDPGRTDGRSLDDIIENEILACLKDRIRHLFEMFEKAIPDIIPSCMGFKGS